MSTEQSPDLWAQLVDMVGELAEDDSTVSKSKLWHSMLLVAMEQAVQSEEETKYTPAAKEAVAHFAQSVGIKPLQVRSRQE